MNASLNDSFHGDITATRRLDGSVKLQVTLGPLRATRLVIEQAEPEVLSRTEDVLTFHSVEDDGSHRSYRYRIVGEEVAEFEGGWLLMEPLP